MKVVIHLPPGSKKVDAERMATAVRSVVALAPGAQVSIELGPASQAARDEDSSRFVLSTMLGTHVATVDRLEGSMAQTLLERAAYGAVEAKCFRSIPDLWAVLEQWPCWKGERHQVRVVYVRLRAKLEGTHYALLRTRGMYGFRAVALMFGLDGETRDGPKLHVI